MTEPKLPGSLESPRLYGFANTEAMLKTILRLINELRVDNNILPITYDDFITLIKTETITIANEKG